MCDRNTGFAYALLSPCRALLLQPRCDAIRRFCSLFAPFSCGKGHPAAAGPASRYTLQVKKRSFKFMINVSVQQQAEPNQMMAVPCSCVLSPFGPNPECARCGGDGMHECDQATVQVQSVALDAATLRSLGFVFDPTSHGRPRWTHMASGRALVRQPYMSDCQWMSALQIFAASFAVTGSKR
jgi:hypothetical protein